MLVFFLITQVFSEDTVSFLDTGSELTLDGHAGIKLLNGDGNCRLGVFNASIPFGVDCRGKYPLYIDEDRHSHFGADVLTEADLVFQQKLVISDQDQWSLVHHDAFETTEAEGWSNSSISECNGVTMLGGYCQFSAGTTEKTLSDLHDHSQVRLRAVWHLIDEWRGETAYVKIGTSDLLNQVWTLTYDVTSAKSPLNVCGESSIGEAKFATAIDIQYPHSSSELKLVFGTNLEEQPCEKSWGISGLEIYIK